jgi:4-hydroxy-tetrahydrodipicolinate synthase
MSRPPVEGDISDYFLRLADVIPVMLYDQGEQGELSIKEDILPLARKSRNIVALKISGFPDRFDEAKELLEIPALCGWDFGSLLAYQMDADGVISGSATIAPREEVKLYELAMEKRWDEARELYYTRLVPILNYCTFDPHAYSASKYFLYHLGLIDNPAVRAPNPDAGAVRSNEIRAVLKRVGLLSPAAGGRDS